MKTHVAMVMLLAAGGLREASARDLPVYRAFTKPITFYDESGRQAEFGGEAPDVALRQQFREARAREALLGPETLLEVSFGSDALDWSQGAVAPPAPRESGQTSERRRSRENDRNWLVQSLTLPSLGLATSNAALSAIGGEGRESGWGWLADGIDRGDEAALENSLSAESDTLADGLPDNGPGQEGSNPFASDGSARGASTADERDPESRAGEPAVREDALAASRPGGEARTEWRADSLTAPEPYRKSWGGAELSEEPALSRTRKLLSDMASVPRADLAAWRSQNGGSDLENTTAGMSRGWGGNLSGAGAAADGTRGWTGGGLGARPQTASASSLNSIRMPAPGWQGGWSAQSESRSLQSRYQPSADPKPLAETLSTAPGLSMPASSGGVKPGWY